MTEHTGLVSPAWIGDLITTAFHAEVPPAVLALVNPEVCARFIEGAKLGIVFPAQGSVRVRIAHDGESEALAAKVSAQWPAVAPWLAGFAGKDVLYETDGEGLRVYVTGVEPGGEAIGALWENGAVGTIHPLASAPAGQPEGGEWVELRVAGRTWPFGNYAAAAGQAIGARAGAAATGVVAHYAAVGLTVAPWSIELDGAEPTFCAWGANAGVDASKLPEIFKSGAPSAEVWAGDLARLVADADVEAARGVLVTLHGVLVSLAERDTPALASSGEAWRFVAGALSGEPPTERLLVLNRLLAANQVPALQQGAYHLAAARYLASHAEAKPPADLPEALAGLDEAGVRTHAQAALAAFEKVEAIAKADPSFDLHRYRGVPAELATVRELLARAISGEFHGAEGPLHDYLVGLGKLGYDDDPNMISVEDVDLEPGSRDAAMEEALANQDDDLTP